MQTDLVFFGSSPFSVIVLEKLLTSNLCNLTSIVTTPDKPVGRHLKLTPNPVKLLAQQHNLPVFTSISDFNSNSKLQITNCVGLVAAYGKIIPQKVLDTFSGQIFNIHPSLLPKYRGPSPLQQQILDGVTETGVTIIQLDAEMDHGPIVAQQSTPLNPDETWQTLGHRLFALGTDLFIEKVLRAISPQADPASKAQWDPRTALPQQHDLATYTKKITRQDGFIPYPEFVSELEQLKNCLQIENCKLKIVQMHKAFAVWPGIWTLDPAGKRLKLIDPAKKLVQLEGESPKPWPLS